MYKKVVLVNSPYYLRGRTIFKYVEGYTIPIGIMSLASVIRRDFPNVQISIVDGLAENLSPNALLERIVETDPDLVGISSFTFNINDTLLLAKWIKRKKPDIKIVLGGVHVTQLSREAINNRDIDFVMRGECDYSFRDLVAGREPVSIKGLLYRELSGVIKGNSEISVVDNLDDLPVLCYDLVKMSKYFPSAGQCHRFPAGTMITSRGCPGNCIFCSSSVSGKKIRCRSAKNIVKEIKFLIDNYGVKEIVFMDDVFTADKSRILEFCRIIKEEKIDLLWDCSTRVQFVDEDLLKTMKYSGCGQISFGVESGDERVLKSIKKGQSLEQVREKVSLSKKIGLETRCSFILGFPEDTLESMQKTIDFAVELDPHLVSFYIASPFPGTEMYDWAVKNNRLLTANFSHYDQSHYIMSISNATPEQMDEVYRHAYRSFYHRFKYILRRLLMMRSLYDIRNAFKAACMTMNIRAVPEVNYSDLETAINKQYENNQGVV